ncbi:ligase-associated DNA damage response DEXH box helicase [Dokdonella sp. MW10]|uniref:ligase-associated DNA damage response DEXH box helicase n=1 Tax=Dokdonella sp. MW10 TaxID=2992926 RepID=UPI003F81CD83
MPTASISSRRWLAAERRLADWLAERSGGRVAPFQRETWRAWRDGASGLVHAPTGSGKTLAAFGGPLVDALARDPAARPGLTLLWITPLRALAADLVVQLEAPLRELGLAWRLLRRTGDSGSRERTRLRKGEVEVLVTTPESLALQLSHADAAQRFAGLTTVVVDEWHELVAGKRGVLLELNLARLRRLAPALRTWGLSATLGNLDEAMQALLGPQVEGRLVSVTTPRRVLIETALPDEVERFAWAGHLGLSQLRRVVEATRTPRSVLVFTNTRSQAELWHEALASVWPHAPDTLAIHHGSLDRALRAQVEEGLRTGAIRCVVATSSLDLGVDFASVEAVVQIGSPRGVARLLQRAGRSNHRPGEASRILCVPTHGPELAEIAAARRALAAGAIEARAPLDGTADVLAQHLVSMALAGGFEAAAMFDEVRTAHAYVGWTRERFDAVLAFVEHGGPALGAYPDYHKLVVEDGRHVIASPRLARLHRYGIGTIVADGSIEVRYLRGGRIGHVEETFAARLAPGETFLFAGRTLELVRVRDMTAWVRLAKGRRSLVPRWSGGRLALSNALGRWMQQVLADPQAREPEMTRLAPLLATQRERSHVPGVDELLVERIKARDGEHLFVFTFAGRLVNEGLGALLATRLSRLAPSTLAFGANDYGVIVSTRRLPALDAEAIRGLLTIDGVRADLLAGIAGGELAKRQFREIARIAGLVFGTPPGTQRSLRHLQAGTGLLYDVLAQHDPGHLLLEQAVDEVLERTFDLRRLEATLHELAARTLVATQPARFTPFAFPLWAEWIRGGLSSEDWETRVRRLAAELEARA